MSYDIISNGTLQAYGNCWNPGSPPLIWRFPQESLVAGKYIKFAFNPSDVLISRFGSSCYWVSFYLLAYSGNFVWGSTEGNLNTNEIDLGYSNLTTTTQRDYIVQILDTDFYLEAGFKDSSGYY